MKNHISNIKTFVENRLTDILTNSHRPLKEDEISVTEVTLCLKKAFLDRKYGWLPVTPVMQKLVFGIGFHKAISSTINNSEKEYRKNVKDYTLVGIPDAIINRTIYEWKTVQRLPPVPLHHHVAQVSLYMWLTELDTAYIVYFTPKGYRNYFRVKYGQSVMKVIDRMLQRGDHLHKCIVKQTPPEEEYSWECENCPYVTQFCIGEEVAKV